VDNWLRHLHDIYKRHRTWMDTLVGDEERLRALCELNVLEQCVNVCETTIVRDAWARGQEVTVHGWVYGLHNGLLKDLEVTVRAPADVDAVYRRALAGILARHSQPPSRNVSRTHSPELGGEMQSPPRPVVSVTSASAVAVAAAAKARAAVAEAGEASSPFHKSDSMEDIFSDMLACGCNCSNNNNNKPPAKESQ
jgi:hypothetical protein